MTVVTDNLGYFRILWEILKFGRQGEGKLDKLTLYSNFLNGPHLLYIDWSEQGNGIKNTVRMNQNLKKRLKGIS